MSSSQGQAQPGQAQHGAGGCAGPNACGLVWGRWCLARTGREARERRALHQAASATATAKAAPGRRAPPRGRGAAIARLHDLCVADCLPLQRETVARQHQPLSPALGATIVVLVKVGAGLHDLNEVDVNMLRAIRGCLSGGRYRAGGRAWAEAAHRCHQKSQRAPCQKSSKLDPRPLGDTPCCLRAEAEEELFAAARATNSFTAYSRLLSAPSILPTHATRRFSTTAVWASVFSPSSVHRFIISRQAASRLPPGASRLPKVAPQYISHSLREHPRLEQLDQHVGTEAADVRLELA